MRIKSYSEIVASMLDKVATRTSLSNFNPGSVIRTLIEIIAAAIAELYDLIAAVLKQGFLATATGFWLELKVREYGLKRKDATYTHGTVIFGSNQASNQNFTIPAGTIVSTLTDSLGRQFRFVTQSPVVLQAGETEVAVAVIAEHAGAAYNVGADSIRKLSVYVSGIDFVRNDVNWITSEGSDKETDEELRRRGFLAWEQLARGGTRAAYAAWALAVPGVKNVFVDDSFPRGQGTVDVYIISTAGVPTTALIQAVQAVIEENKPITSNALARSPVVRGISVDIVITPKRFVDTAQIEAEIRARLDAFFNPVGDLAYAWIDPLGIGRDVVLNQLRHLAMSVSGVYNVVFNTPQQDIVVSPAEFPVLANLGIAFAPATTEQV